MFFGVNQNTGKKAEIDQARRKSYLYVMKQSLLKRPLPYVQKNMTLWLIIINVGVFFITYLRPDIRDYLALIPGLVVKRYFVWQFVTYMFCHANFNHILMNMIGLFFFGHQVEQTMGSYEFLLYYLVTGILAGLLSFGIFMYTGGYWITLLGASGAVFAVLLAFATFYPDARILFMFILPVRAWVLVLFFIGITLFYQFSGMNSGVAHLTHLAGFGFGFLYFILRLGINPVDRIRPPSSRRGPWR